MNGRIIRFLGIALILGAVAVVWSPLRTFLAVDACLDTGGSFDYVKGMCDYARSHPYLAQGNAVRVAVAVLLAAAGAAAIGATSRHSTGAASGRGDSGRGNSAF
jgi:hypothetical protein